MMRQWIKFAPCFAGGVLITTGWMTPDHFAAAILIIVGVANVVIGFWNICTENRT